MKKWFCALGMMLALLMSVALADGVKVTFAEKNGQINGGYDYTLKLNVSPASDKDLTVWTARIPWSSRQGRRAPR